MGTQVREASSWPWRGGERGGWETLLGGQVDKFWGDPGLWGHQGFLGKAEHRLRPEGWVGQLSWEWGLRGGAGLGELLRTIGDMGIRGLGTPGWRYLGGHGTCRAEVQRGDMSQKQLWSQRNQNCQMGKVHRRCPWRAQEGIIRQLHFVPKAVGSHRGSLSRDGTAFEFQFPSMHHSLGGFVCAFFAFFFFTYLFFRPSIFYP